MTTKKTALCVALVATSALGLRGSPAEHRAFLSGDLVAHQARHTGARARVIVQGDDATLEAVARRHHLQILRRLNGAAVLAANSAELSELATDAAVDHLSGDLPVSNWMSVSNKSTAADQVRAGAPGLPGITAVPGVTGQGIGVAVLDSGVSSHNALSNKVSANVSFVTGDPAVTDAFGHGTHVAGIIAGTASAAAYVTPLYTGGIAPNAKIINVRVLGADGTGLVSDVIAGIEWVINNRSAYNIRVINLSLGHPVFESATTDPLCVEVQKAVDNGIVVVVAAGNKGKTPDGRTILGGISSPGNSPAALTVGALNTFGTVSRSDDAVTTYSSRGPTRFDHAVKPDLAAPGNKIVSLEANNSVLPGLYSTLHVAGKGTNSYMTLSGTSMAAPMVSGAVALLLQGTPSMSPAHVKLVMQSGATYVANGGLMGAGAGSANFWASRKIAASGLIGSLVNTVVGGLGVTASGASYWDKGTLSDRLYKGDGYRLLSLLDLPKIWLNPSLLYYGDLNLIGLTNPLARVSSCPLLWGVVSTWTTENQINWGDTVHDPQGQSIMWGDSGTADDTSIMWGDAMASPDPQ